MIVTSVTDSRRQQKYLTVSDVADHLQLPVETVYMYARTGVIPAAKIGKHWRFSLDRIEEWMSRQEAVDPVGEVRVLMVEPDVQISEAFKTWFSEAGCEVYAVASREQAFPLLNEKQFDLILLDLMDPRLGGLETLRDIHALKPTAEIVVAASRFDAEVMDRALDVGPLTVLRRPVAKVDVQRLVETHRHDVAQRRRQQGGRGSDALSMGSGVRREQQAQSTADSIRGRVTTGRKGAELGTELFGTGDAYTI